MNIGLCKIELFFFNIWEHPHSGVVISKTILDRINEFRLSGKIYT